MASRSNNNWFSIFLAITTVAFCARVQAYPELTRLDRTDVLFKQLNEDVDLFYRAYARGEMLPPLTIYSYVPSPDEDLLSIAARLNISVSSIASLNGISNPTTPVAGTRLMIPNQKGIFVAYQPKTELERLSSSIRLGTDTSGVEVRVGIDELREFLFIPGADYHSVERSFFLGILFRFPLPQGVITSGYGTRASPFSGHQSFHSGVDIGAPHSTEVLAARGGTAAYIGIDDVLGLHIILQHEGGYESVYGHLNAAFLELNQQVESGTIIGEVGTSGATTGPHLHFEIRKGTAPQDPLKYIQNGKP